MHHAQHIFNIFTIIMVSCSIQFRIMCLRLHNICNRVFSNVKIKMKMKTNSKCSIRCSLCFENCIGTETNTKEKKTGRLCEMALLWTKMVCPLSHRKWCEMIVFVLKVFFMDLYGWNWSNFGMICCCCFFLLFTRS